MKNFLKKKLLNSNVSRWVVLAIDLYIVANTFIIAYLIRFNFIFSFDISKLNIQVPLVCLIALLSFLFTEPYRGVIRHTGYRDAVKIVKSTTLIFVALALIVLVNRTFNVFDLFTIPLSILIIHYLLNIVVLITSRYIYKLIYHLIITEIKIEHNVLVYGAGDTGLIVYSVLRNDRNCQMDIKGFVDSDKGKFGKIMNGVPIYNPESITQDFIKKKNIDEIIISIQNISSHELMDIFNHLEGLPVKVKIVPPVKDWINNNLNAHQIKPIKIEDLLGRTPIKLSNPILEMKFYNKSILITGAAGSIGSEISRQIEPFKYAHLILVDQAESDLYNIQQYFWNCKITNFTIIVGDVRNQKRMEAIFEEYKPDIIFHAAAYKHVPLMEEYPSEAIGINVVGTKIIADLCVAYNVEKCVFISTDKAVNPTNVMGATKRIAELYINSLNKLKKTKFSTTRFGNVLGSNGSVIPLFKSQIKKGGPITVTDPNITRYFMTIHEACQLVLEACAMGNKGELFVFDMGKSIKIYDLALKMIQLSGLKYPEDIKINISGLRPGEKIKEEVLAKDECTLPTHHPKIRIAKVTPLDAIIISEKINNLCKNNAINTPTESIIKMKEIVPEYISNNSIFEALDVSKKIKM